MSGKKVVFALIPSLACAVFFAVTYYRLGLQKTPAEKGRDLNEEAWQATFSERGLPVPPSGPFDGYWGRKLKTVPSAELGWFESKPAVDGIADIDEDGVRHWRPLATPTHRLLILGGSAAAGAYASSGDARYFAVLGRALESRGFPCHIRVLAAGGWKSAQELAALKMQDPDSFDLVILLDGLNDLTAGPTADALMHDAVSIDDLPPSIHREYELRAMRYVEHVADCGDVCRRLGRPMLVVLQPALHERTSPSSLERRIIKASTGADSVAATEKIRWSLNVIRTAASSIAEEKGIRFVDYSRLFNDEAATTFTDTWHFTDPAHAILGEAMAGEVVKLLK